MSINNSVKYDKIKNNCNHTEQLNKNKILNKSYFFCYKCNHIILLYKNKTYSLYKYIPKEEFEDDINNLQMEFDPILTVKTMLKRQEEQIQYINDKLVLNFSNNYMDETNKEFFENKNNKYITEKINELNNDKDNINKNEYEDEEKYKKIKKVDSEIISIDDSINKKKNKKFPVLLFDEESFEKYCSQRNKILVYIHKLCTKLKYNDNSFYITLYLSDTYLSKFFSDDISEKELFLVILGFFLISSKYIEDDIFEPELETFSNIEKKIEALTIDEIRTSEVQCLTLINHNLYIYSVYDWVNIFLNNGIIFEDEIMDINGIDKFYIYTQKILTFITSKIYFCRYSSIQIALSIIQITREKFANKNLKPSEKLYELLLSIYGIEFSDYEECYNIMKIDISESDEIDEDEDEEQELSSNANSKINLNTNIKISNQEIKDHLNNSKTLNNQRNNYKIDKISKNKYRISVDSNNRKRYIKTDVNTLKNKNEHYLLSSLDNKRENFPKERYKLIKNNNKNGHQNNSIEILEHYHANKKLTPSLITNTNNTSLNNTSIKSHNLNSNNLLLNSNKGDERNLILNNKNYKSNTLHVNYAPKLLIKNNGPIINNINYINNINITNGEVNLFQGNDYKFKNNKNHDNNTNSNLNYGIKKYNNKNNEIRSTTNHVLRKALFNLENIIPIQLNYEYNINSISNNKIKTENNIQNIIAQNKMKNNFKNIEKLKLNNKEKFKTHLLLEYNNNPNLNTIFLNKNNIPTIINKETKSLNKYITNEYDKNLEKKLKHFDKNKNEVKILNTNININMSLKNNNIKSKKITLNFRDIINKKLNSEHTNKFLTNNNIKNNKRFRSLHNNNLFNKESIKNADKKYAIFNNENNHNDTNDNKNSIKNKDNIYINPNEFGKKQNINLNYKNMVSIRPQLPKLRINKKSVLTS